jgi:pyruvate,water dikinase
MSEMVINVGLGMGEGIVSGKVATDKIVINKDRFTKRDRHSFRYTTNDKREQVVFDRVSGQGTKLADTIYHQRQRPALEYAELRQLVDTAIRLEKSYHHPLDIEFAFEGTRLWVLQVRPVPSYQSDIRETIQYYPFSDQIK